MAVVALHTAASGLSALSTNLDIIANNLANVNTTGFKSQRANFEDLLYQEKQQAGAENANGDQRPAGLVVGLGTRISNTQFDFSTGSPQSSGKDTDVMIEGRGLFKVRLLESQGPNGVGFTRAGNFMRNRDGDLVLGNTDGPRIEPPVNIPADAGNIQITPDGRVFATVGTQTEPSEVGRIQLAGFLNPNGLKSIGGNLFVETAASGPAIDGNAGEGSFGVILQGFLESSNVDPVRELVELIKTQRSFQMNSQSIQAADETLQSISQLRR